MEDVFHLGLKAILKNGDGRLLLLKFEPNEAGEEHVAQDWVEPKQAAELLKIKYPAEICQAVAKL